MFITQHMCFPLFSVLSYDFYHVFWVKMITLFGVSILVTTNAEHFMTKQTLLCNKHNVSNLILGIHSSHNRSITSRCSRKEPALEERPQETGGNRA